MLVVPCDYVECKRNPHFPDERFFKVTLFLLVVDLDDSCPSTYTFLHEADQRENYRLLRESNVDVEVCQTTVIVSRLEHSSLYNKIIEYDNVLKSSNCKECKPKYTFSKH